MNLFQNNIPIFNYCSPRATTMWQYCRIGGVFDDAVQGDGRKEDSATVSSEPAKKRQRPTPIRCCFMGAAAIMVLSVVEQCE